MSSHLFRKTNKILSPFICFRIAYSKRFPFRTVSKVMYSIGCQARTSIHQNYSLYTDAMQREHIWTPHNCQQSICRNDIYEYNFLSIQSEINYIRFYVYMDIPYYVDMKLKNLNKKKL